MPSIEPMSYPKQPSEKEYIAIEFGNRMVDDDVIASITECKCYNGDTEVTSTLIESPVIDGTAVKMWVKAGTSGTKYDLTVKVTTSLGYKLEADLVIDVRERGHA